MRDELLNEGLFFDLDHARAKIARWVADYNERRPHSGSAISRRLPTQPISPQCAIVPATPTNLAARALLHQRQAL
jgi:hypothetical protein